MNKFIPANTPAFEGNELKYLEKAINTTWVSSEGPFISEFEDKFSSFVNREFGIAVSSGSAALDIAVAALDIGPGDEVIMPTFTIISPALSVVRAGATPVLVDSDPLTFNMEVSAIEGKITAKTKAIIVVHVYGLPVDMNPILDLCAKYRLFLIEDAAEMIGQSYYGKKCGSFGHISTFSFYPNKQITTGEGGMIVCDDKALSSRCKKLRNLAFDPAKPRFVHDEMAWNYRLTNLQAALGLAQLETVDTHVEHIRSIGKAYQDGLDKISGFQLPLVRTAFAENSYWVFGMVAENEVLKDKVVSHLNDCGIATRPFFWSMHQQPVFQKRGLFSNESYPVSEKLSRRGFYLPGGVGLSMEDVAIVISTIQHFKSEILH